MRRAGAEPAAPHRREYRSHRDACRWHRRCRSAVPTSCSSGCRSCIRSSSTCRSTGSGACWRRLGHPERRLPPVVHVAGTNGKGSVIAYLRAMLEAAGQRVHVYTSPHLVRFHERIRLAGKLIAEPHLLELLEECERANGGDADHLLRDHDLRRLPRLRARAGRHSPARGRPRRRVRRHQRDRPPAAHGADADLVRPHAVLGNTLTAIAGDKAGIMKRGVPAVVGPQPPEAAGRVRGSARRARRPLSRHGREWQVDARRRCRMVFRDAAGERRLPLPAPHRRASDRQCRHRARLPAVSQPRLASMTPAIRAACADVEWPARMQRLRRGSAGRAAAGGLGAVARRRPQRRRRPRRWPPWPRLGGGAAGKLPLHLIFASLSTHDPLGILQPFGGLARDVHTVVVPGDHKTLAARSRRDAARSAGHRGHAGRRCDAPRSPISSRQARGPRAC